MPGIEALYVLKSKREKQEYDVGGTNPSATMDQR